MRKFFATAFLLGITSVFPAQALDLSSIGQSAKPAGSSVMFQNDGENKKNETSVVRQQPAEPAAPATAPAAPKPQKLFPGAVKIVAVVNGEILTTEDLENRGQCLHHEHPHPRQRPDPQHDRPAHATGSH